MQKLKFYVLSIEFLSRFREKRGTFFLLKGILGKGPNFGHQNVVKTGLDLHTAVL